MARITSPRIQHDTPRKNRFVGRVLAREMMVDAAVAEGIPYETGKKIMKKFRLTGSVSNRARSGRPKKTTPRDERRVIRSALQERRKPVQVLANEVPFKVSKNIIRRILRDAGLRRCVARRKPYLREHHKKARLEFARYRKGFGPIDFMSTIWSDECYICLDDKGRRVFVTRRPEEEFDEECLVPAFKQSPVRVMVWGCIMAGRKGPLVVLEYPGGRGGGMTAERYQEQVLEGALKAFYEEVKEERGLVDFQQDGAPCHTAKSTLRWFENAGIPVAEHPPSSPDLSPIEGLWYELKDIIHSGDLPTSVDTLIAATRAAWDALPQERVDQYVFSMPNRIQAVLDAKGGHTRF